MSWVFVCGPCFRLHVNIKTRLELLNKCHFFIIQQKFAHEMSVSRSEESENLKEVQKTVSRDTQSKVTQDLGDAMNFHPKPSNNDDKKEK